MTNKPTTPTLWRDMTPEEKLALLLAEREGSQMQVYVGPGAWIDGGGWDDIECPLWEEKAAYRAKPQPVRETVTLYGEAHTIGWCFSPDSGIDNETHRLTFDLIDGKPDCNSVKMEEL